ncbi:transporter [Devosia pacifica]|uniref:Transporter n=1 Tax=Devosia pacifica TaxID=1335967 RepID=A0A918VSZ2_9HYPH|nr:carbohydrate ABC transporter permease [Devosia pacifica]GHA22010.1 transporter [Devosia pacifica]
MSWVKKYGLSAAAIAISLVVFVVPFIFIIFMAVKDQQQSAQMDFSWPTSFHVVENFVQVIQARDFMLITAYINSTVITVTSVALLVVLSALVGFVLQRRVTWWTPWVDFFILAGLMMPPAVVPTITLMQQLGIFKTIHGLVLIEVAYNMSFSVILFRNFIATIPRELDEAAIIDGARPLSLFFRVILPMLKPVTVTVIVVQTVAIFNDFVNPLYYLPGRENATVQLTLYNFQSQFVTEYNLLFMNILLITIPPLVVFLFFNRQIVAGMSAGAIKG